MTKVDFINEKLKEKLITQRELADKVGINEVSMSRYLNGHRDMPDDLVCKCLEAINEVTE